MGKEDEREMRKMRGRTRMTWRGEPEGGGGGGRREKEGEKKDEEDER